MRKFYLLTVLVLISCFSEDNADLGKSETFIRYYNGGYNDAAVALAETSDQGFIILANTQLEDNRYKIKLIKTDAQGNKQWSRVYPDFIASASDPLFNRKASGLLLVAGGGYVIAGEDIDASGRSHLYILVLNENGDVVTEKTFPSPTIPVPLSIRGVAISENTGDTDANGNPLSYVVLATILNSVEDNMIAAQINKSDLSMSWTRAYGSGNAAYLVNKLYLDTQNKLVWGGEVARQNRSDVRLVRTLQNSQNTDFDLPIGKPDRNERGRDLCKFGFGYAVVGSSDDTPTGEYEILVQRLGEDGTVIFSGQYPITIPGDNGQVTLPGNKIGNALTTTRDGGLFIAGTVPSDAALGFGAGETDYYLIKTDGFGNVMWQKPVGSRDEDESVAVIQASDGSLVLCGNTILAGLGTILLMKMDSEGNVQ